MSRSAPWIITSTPTASSTRSSRLTICRQNGRPVTSARGGYRQRQRRRADPNQHRPGRRPAFGLHSSFEAGGDTNTISVVEGIKYAVKHLLDVPKELISQVVFDQSVFVKTAIETLLHEGAIGLFLTSVMILVFLGSMRATVAVFFSIPLSALATFVALSLGGSSVNSMVLGGLALAFSRLIDNSVVVLENIYRHLELGEPPETAAEKGGAEVAPAGSGRHPYDCCGFLSRSHSSTEWASSSFSALALAVVLSLFASYIVAMTVVPLFCSRFIKAPAHHGTPASEIPVVGGSPEGSHESSVNASTSGSTTALNPFSSYYDRAVGVALRRSGGDNDMVRRDLRDQHRPVPVAGDVVLPADRRRPVRHQSQGAARHTPVRDGRRSR